jgi:hypothetical protein
MTIPRVLLGAAILSALSIPLAAQQAPTGYHHVQCVKINPGKMAAVGEFIAGASHKLGQSLVDSGHYANTFVLRTAMPRGTDAECDYLFVAFFNGLPTGPMSAEEVTAALHKADVPMTAEQLYAKEDELGKLVTDDILQTQLRVGGAKKGDYLVVNSMSAPDAGACVAAQKKIWQPVEEEMVKAGKTSGWVVNAKRFPRGTKDGNVVSSVDIYPSWDAFLNEYSSISSAWQKVHPDMEFNSTMQQFEKQCTITHTVLYKVVDAITPAK